MLPLLLLLLTWRDECHSPGAPYQPANQYFCNGPRLHEFLKELNKECFSKYE